MLTPVQARSLGLNYRRQLAPARRTVYNSQLQSLTAALPGRVAAYLALPDEAAPWCFAKTAYLPVIQPDQTLKFRCYRQGDPLEPGALGISVPSSGPLLDVADMDWVLVPLTAIDGVGVRTGLGGGYYDRTLIHAPQMRRVGVAYPGQRVDRIAAQPWDVPLGRLVTPAGWTRF